MNIYLKITIDVIILCIIAPLSVLALWLGYNLGGKIANYLNNYLNKKEKRE